MVEPKDLEMMTQQAMYQGGGLMTTIFALVGAVMWLRRKYTHDGLEMKRDQSEGRLLEIVIKERNSAMDEAREAWAKRASDAEMIGKLSATVESLTQLNHKTNNEVHLLRLLNEKQGREISNIRNDMRALRDQIRSCATCPLRKLDGDEGDKNELNS